MEYTKNQPGLLLPQWAIFVHESNGIDVGQAQIQQALEAAGMNCIVVGISDPGDISSEQQPVKFSVVVPIYNEAKNILELYRRLTAVMTDLNESHELILVNDGSQDRSLALLTEIHQDDPEHVRVITLTRNFGHQQAISAGIDHARGQAVIIMDADLQDPPEVLPRFVDKWRAGFQVVYAVREKRKEHILKRMAYHSFYLILRSVSSIDIPLDAGDFCLMDRAVVDVLVSLPERDRFVRGLRSWVGFKQTGLVYERDARFAGESKYTFSRLVSLALDGLISFSHFPLRLATVLGFGVSTVSLLAAAYYLIKKLMLGLGPPGFATQVVLISFLGGVQLITIGVIGEYIGHVLDEVKHRPTYVVQKVMEQVEVDEKPARVQNHLMEDALEFEKTNR